MGLDSFEKRFQELSKPYKFQSNWSRNEDTAPTQTYKKLNFLSFEHKLGQSITNFVNPSQTLLIHHKLVQSIKNLFSPSETQSIHQKLGQSFTNIWKNFGLDSVGYFCSVFFDVLLADFRDQIWNRRNQIFHKQGLKFYEQQRYFL